MPAAKKKAPTRGKKRALSPEKTTNATKESVVAQGGAPAKRARASTASEVVARGAVDESNAVGPTAAAAAATPTVPVVSDETQPEKIAKPQYIGTFDLYGMELPFLEKVYVPGRNAAELYKTILTYQAKKDNTARIIFPENLTVGDEGEFICDIFCDPMEEMPFDHISASGIKEVAKLNFKSMLGRPTEGTWNGGGIKAELELDGGGCGISSSSGSISMHPMWRKAGEDGEVMELFEGTFTFKIKYSSLYSRKGHGSGQSLTIDFWAVRGLKENT